MALHPRNLTTIYVTHGHFDHFYGLSVLLNRFPDARAIATPKSVEVMHKQLESGVLDQFARRWWPGHLAAYMVAAEPYADDTFTLEASERHRGSRRSAGAENFPDGYADAVEKATDGGAIITVHFASQTRWPAPALAGKSRRLTYAVNHSAPEHKRSKPGWFLYSAASTPRPARGEFDLDAEKELLLADVRDYFPGFDQHATILTWDITAHEWPAQRAVTGYDLPIETPVGNLWNVGDGVKLDIPGS